MAAKLLEREETTFSRDPRSLQSFGFSGVSLMDSTDVPLFICEGGPSNAPAMRTDALFGAEQMNYVISKAIEQKFAPLTATQAFNLKSEGGWADTITRFFSEGFGRAAKICCAADFPRVSIDGSEVRLPTITIGASMEICYSEGQRGNYAGLDIAAQKMNMVRRAIEQLLNDMAWYGDTDSNIMGVGNNPMVGQVNLPVRFDDYSVNTMDLLVLLKTALRKNSIASSGTYSLPTHLAMGPATYGALADRYIGGSLEFVTVYDKLLKDMNLQVTQVPQMDCMNGQRMIFAYNKAEVEWNVPIVMEVLPAVQNGYGYTVNVIARVNSLWIPYTRNALKIVG